MPHHQPSRHSRQLSPTSNRVHRIAHRTNAWTVFKLSWQSALSTSGCCSDIDAGKTSLHQSCRIYVGSLNYSPSDIRHVRTWWMEGGWGTHTDSECHDVCHAASPRHVLLYLSTSSYYYCCSHRLALHWYHVSAAIITWLLLLCLLCGSLSSVSVFLRSVRLSTFIYQKKKKLKRKKRDCSILLVLSVFLFFTSPLARSLAFFVVP